MHVFSAMVGMARRAVPARVVAGGTNIRATLAIEGVAPLYAARTSQRDVPTTLNTYSGIAGVRVWRSALVLGRSRFERWRDLGESRCFLEAETLLLPSTASNPHVKHVLAGGLKR